MAQVFRVVNIADQKEMNRFVDLVGACVLWVKNPRNLRVEALEAGSSTATREVSRSECCSALRQWLPQNKHFVSEDERADMKELIDEACGNVEIDFRQ